jgi:hypothetical protein
MKLDLRPSVLASTRSTYEESELSTGSVLLRKRAKSEPSNVTASTRQDGESVVATSAGLVERRFAQHSGRLIIDSDTGVPRLMKLPPQCRRPE